MNWLNRKETPSVSATGVKKNSRRKKTKMSFPLVKGCYFVACIPRRKVYIGQSTNINRRLTAHIQALSGGRHEIPAMQSDYDRLGPEHFTLGIFFQADSPEGKELDREMILAKCAYIGAMEKEVALFSSRETPFGTVSGPLIPENLLYKIASAIHVTSPAYMATNRVWKARHSGKPVVFTPNVQYKNLFANVSTAVEAVTISSIPSEFLYNRDSFRTPNRAMMLHYLLASKHFRKLGNPVRDTIAQEKSRIVGHPRRLFPMQEYFLPTIPDA
jgi:hypothetical protein